MIFCFVRETKQLTLEEIDRKQFLSFFSLTFPFRSLTRSLPFSPHHSIPLPKQQQALTPETEVFQVPTSRFLSHEINVMVPYFVKSKILRQRIPRPPAIIDREDAKWRSDSEEFQSR
jgi:hypothetical protein